MATDPVYQTVYVPTRVQQQDFFSLSDGNILHNGADTSQVPSMTIKTISTEEDHLSGGGKRISTLSFDPSIKYKHVLCKQEPCDGDAFELQNQENVGLVEVTEDGQYVCTLCQQLFTSLISLQSHMKVHAVKSEHPYSEDYESFEIDDPFKLSGQRPHKCSICKRKFFTKTDLRNHMRVHSGDTPFRCTFCVKRFTHGKNLHRHLKSVHKDDSGNAAYLCTKLYRAANSAENRLIIYTGEGPKPYKCSVCSKTFRRLYRVKEHSRVHSGQKPFQCSVCTKLFSSSDILYRHIKRLHNGGVPLAKVPKVEVVETDHESQAVIQVSQNPFNIQQVTVTTNEVNFLNIPRHSEIIDMNKIEETSYANQGFHQLNMRSDFGDQLHVQVAQPQEIHQMQQLQSVELVQQEQTMPQGAFQCSICGETFETSPLLTKHISIHKIQVPTTCLICQKEFKSDNCLKRHMNIHTEDKSYKCTICEKSFHRQYRLINHMRSHTGEKPYQCSVCRKCFSVSDNMYRHIKKMHKGEGLQYAIGLVKQIQDLNREKKFSSRNNNSS